MLDIPAPFPQVGSYALHEHERKTLLARIQQRDGDSVLISYPALPGASGNTTIPLSELRDGTPLTDLERTEMNGLADDLRRPQAHSARKGAKMARRRDELRLRDIRSGVLDNLLRAAGVAPLARAA